MSETIETKPVAETSAGFAPLKWWQAGLLVLGAAGCFHAAYTPAKPGLLSLLIVGYVVCLVQLARLRTTRQSFYVGLLIGLACNAPQLGFFWGIFGPAAMALWMVLAFWIALFVMLAHLALARFGVKRAVWLVPFLWTGLEYFRSELYYLKFAWLNVGFAWIPEFGFGTFGVYGVGFCVAFVAAVFPFILERFLKRMTLIELLACVAIAAFLAGLLLPVLSGKLRFHLRLAGIQLEFPNASQIGKELDKVVAKHEEHLSIAQGVIPGNISGYEKIGYRVRTNLDIIVLPEYTLGGEPPEELKEWCRANGKYLIVGGRQWLDATNYYNTAFVISTNGAVVFRQAKSVPIQFFNDGLPAPEQRVWESPWGKIGICICYDLSYTRVTDELVRQGAQLLIVPTMDVNDWGRHQHELHARIAPVRAAEYGVPIFRVASSGISQGVNAHGNVRASAPFPGDGEMIFFATRLGKPGSLPLDRWLAPLCVGVTGLFAVWLVVEGIRRQKFKPQMGTDSHR